MGLQVIRIDLDGQFRCGGSRLYENWLNAFLELEEKGFISWTEDPNFKVEVVNSPEQMESQLRDLASEGYKSRITAGYCWTWHDPNPDGTLPFDVKIGEWSKPWNVKVTAASADTCLGNFGQSIQKDLIKLDAFIPLKDSNTTGMA